MLYVGFCRPSMSYFFIFLMRSDRRLCVLCVATPMSNAQVNQLSGRSERTACFDRNHPRSSSYGGQTGHAVLDWQRLISDAALSPEGFLSRPDSVPVYAYRYRMEVPGDDCV